MTEAAVLLLVAIPLLVLSAWRPVRGRRPLALAAVAAAWACAIAGVLAFAREAIR